MASVCQTSACVNVPLPRRGPGQPSKQTPGRVQAINRAVVQAALAGSEIPSDVVLAREHGISERTVRDIRLQTLGLNRHELKQWQQEGARESSTHRPAEPELVCTTPFAGLLRPAGRQAHAGAGDPSRFDFGGLVDLGIPTLVPRRRFSGQG